MTVHQRGCQGNHEQLPPDGLFWMAIDQQKTNKTTEFLQMLTV